MNMKLQRLYVLQPTSQQFQRVSSLPITSPYFLFKGCKVATVDLLSEPSLNNFFSTNQQSFDIVIHLAAVMAFYPKDIDAMKQVNITGTKNLVSSCARSKVKRFVFISSTESLGPIESPPGDENSPQK